MDTLIDMKVLDVFLAEAANPETGETSQKWVCKVEDPEVGIFTAPILTGDTPFEEVVAERFTSAEQVKSALLVLKGQYGWFARLSNRTEVKGISSLTFKSVEAKKPVATENVPADPKPEKK